MSWKKGDKAKIVSRTNNHNFEIGEKVTIVLGGKTPQARSETTGACYNVHQSDLSNITLSLEEIKNETKEHEERLDFLAQANVYMEEEGVDEVDEDELRVYLGVKALENTELSVRERAKRITALMRFS